MVGVTEHKIKLFINKFQFKYGFKGPDYGCAAKKEALKLNP